MTKRAKSNVYRVRGSFTLRAPFSIEYEFDDGEIESGLLTDFGRLADSGAVEEAISRVLAGGNYDIDPNDVEIDDVKKVKK